MIRKALQKMILHHVVVRRQQVPVFGHAHDVGVGVDVAINIYICNVLFL